MPITNDNTGVDGGTTLDRLNTITSEELDDFLNAPLTDEQETLMSQDGAADDFAITPADEALMSRLESQLTDPEAEDRFTDTVVDQIDRELEQDDPDPFPPTSVLNLFPSEVGYWAEDEDDEMGQMPDGDDSEDDSMVTAVAENDLDLQRDIRQYTRVAAWDMPLLAKYAKPFQLPSTSQPLRFRYTTYMGETHPAENKVVVTFTTQDLATATSLSEQQRIKLIKLVGPRYNPDTDTVRMSSEKHAYAAQNKRYLGDLVNKLVAECKEGQDSFEDVPLDFRHHKPKKVHTFPENWKMTQERVQTLRALRGPEIGIEGPEQQGEMERERERVPEYVMANPASRGGPESRYQD